MWRVRQYPAGLVEFRGQNSEGSFKGFPSLLFDTARVVEIAAVELDRRSFVDASHLLASL